MKKLLIFGAIALVVVACVLAAGCTSTTTTTTTPATTTEDFAVGTWTGDDGTIAFFTNDFKGVVTDGTDAINFTWKKTADGKYELINENGSKTTMTLDNVKGTITISNGDVLTKITSNTSGALSSEKNNVAWVKFYGKNTSDYIGRGVWESNIKEARIKPIIDDPNEDYCLGYFTEPEGGIMVFDYNANFADDNIPGYVENGIWVYKGNDQTIQLYQNTKREKHQENRLIISGDISYQLQ